MAVYHTLSGRRLFRRFLLYFGGVGVYLMIGPRLRHVCVVLLGMTVDLVRLRIVVPLGPTRASGLNEEMIPVSGISLYDRMIRLMSRIRESCLSIV